MWDAAKRALIAKYGLGFQWSARWKEAKRHKFQPRRVHAESHAATSINLIYAIGVQLANEPSKFIICNSELKEVRVCIKARANKSKQHFADYRHFVYQCGCGKFINPTMRERCYMRALENFHTRILSRQCVYIQSASENMSRLRFLYWTCASISLSRVSFGCS